MLHALFAPRAIFSMFGIRGEEYVTERAVFVQTPAAADAPEPRPEPEELLPVRPPVLVIAADPTPPPVAAVAPPPVSTVVSAPPTDTGSAPPVGVGGAGGAANARGRTGIGSPDYSDTRIWGAPLKLPDPVVRTGLARMEFGIDSAMREARDSIASKRNPLDWTTGEGGKKIGIDPQWIHLGKIKIPTMLLSLIPLNVQQNPNMRENHRTLGAMAAEVRTRGPLAEAQGNENKAIVARLERERARKKEAAAAAGSGGGGSVGVARTIPPR